MEEHDLVSKDGHAESAAVAEPNETQESNLTALPLAERSLPDNSSKSTSDSDAVEQSAHSQDGVMKACTHRTHAVDTVILAFPRTQIPAMKALGEYQARCTMWRTSRKQSLKTLLSLPHLKLESGGSSLGREET